MLAPSSFAVSSIIWKLCPLLVQRPATTQQCWWWPDLQKPTFEHSHHLNASRQLISSDQLEIFFWFTQILTDFWSPTDWQWPKFHLLRYLWVSSLHDTLGDFNFWLSLSLSLLLS